MDYIKIALLVILIGVIMVDILKNGQACKIFSKYIYRIYILQTVDKVSTVFNFIQICNII